MKKAKRHTIYKNKDGVEVPGTTTVTGVLAKPALIIWANRLGLQGYEVEKWVDELADVGTLAHYLIECDLKKIPPDLSDYSPNQIDLAENAVLKFYEWQEQNKFKKIESELQLVSEKYQFGGTCDIYCELNGKKCLIDLKTSKAIFEEHYLQVAAYRQLLIENGYPVEVVRILRIGRDESEGFEDRIVPFLDLYWEKFLACLRIYQIDRAINKAKKGIK